MRYAVLGDIHSNLHALEVVLDHMDREGVDRVLCVGDIVGYGAGPEECVQIMREREALVVAGNHDWAVADRIDTTNFNAYARDSVDWTRQRLSDEELSYLAELPLVEQLENLTIVHSDLYSPEFFGYIQTLYDAALSFQQMKKPVCFLGHSHVPIVFYDGDPITYFCDSDFAVPNGVKAIVNVGSVGQPRDSDPRASYVIYDDQKRRILIRRVPYDTEAAAFSILDAGLPAANARRLMVGM